MSAELIYIPSQILTDSCGLLLVVTTAVEQLKVQHHSALRLQVASAPHWETKEETLLILASKVREKVYDS